VQVHPEYGHVAISISDKLLSQHDDNDSSLAFWQLTCPPPCLLRTVAFRVLSGKAASLSVERLWFYARAVLRDNRRSMLMQSHTRSHLQPRLLVCPSYLLLRRPSAPTAAMLWLGGMRRCWPPMLPPTLTNSAPRRTIPQRLVRTAA
jgi:hypothetical protein